MATHGSTIFTVGTLLNRAQDQGMPVRTLVQGNWLEGVPVASDSHGVVLDNPDEGQYLIRLDAITAVVYLRDPRTEDEPAPSAPTAHAAAQQDERDVRTGYAPSARPAVEAGAGG
ncbi:hypothetical protein [Nocardioides sp. 616]|uniref:hypothetical protein n=1 Tax=Nocardioides sp. 616 TaxID=2268090 RepID=UPI000CE562EE|nr:hypothetical protein [Nocardioides sp. 616]